METNKSTTKSSSSKSSSSSSSKLNISKSSSTKSLDQEIKSLAFPSLARLTNGLPRHELTLIMMEAEECEEALLKEIRLLEAAAGLPLTPDPVVNAPKLSCPKKLKETNTSTSSSNNNTTATTSTKSSDPPKESKTEEKVDPDSSLALGGWAYDAMEGLNYHTNVDSMMTSEMTPTDRYFSLSALLGRLRQPLDLEPTPQASSFKPSNTSSSSAINKANTSSSSSSTKSNKNKQSSSSNFTSDNNNSSSSNSRRKSTSKKNNNSSNDSNHASSSSGNYSNNHHSSSSSNNASNAALEKQQQNERKQKFKFLEKQKALLSLEKNPIYYKTLEQSQLLTLWKRIQGHRTATVFRRPVSSRDAPGYEDRILFPIDMSLIRKMITSGIITSYSDLHQRIGLICHNCVKFNGRESDYGVITRDFEAYVDDVIVGVVATVTVAAAAAQTSTKDSSQDNNSGVDSSK